MWLPMMPGDDAQTARRQARDFEDRRVIHTWDQNLELGNLFSKTLGLQWTAWDVYMLYAPGTTWEGREAPQPTFWMHQLPTDSGAASGLLLNPPALSKQVLELLHKGNEPNLGDLGWLLHSKGLMKVAGEGSASSVAD